MTRSLKLVGSVVAFMFLFSAVAYAALPIRGAVYTGQIQEGGTNGRVRIVAETRRKLDVLKVTDGCGTVHLFRDVAVREDGSFRKIQKHPEYGIMIFEVKGKFITRSKATGTVSQITCSGGGEFTALKR